MPITLDGTNGITTPTYGGADTSEYLVPVTAFKNRIINGGMVIDQRNAGASVTPNSSYTLDRWYIVNTQTSKFTLQQNAGSVTPPVGFRNYLGITSSSAYSVLTGDTFALNQNIEGFNIADLMWGTANAQTVTLSFWVRSSLTGTFGGSICNVDGSRAYPFSYTISSANTWEQKSITIAGDTTGTWNTNNTTGLILRFGLGSGATFSGTAGAWGTANAVQPTGTVSVVGTNGATFYITGVQLEVGSTATSFDYRPYGTELQLCQRYLPAFNSSGTVPLGAGYTYLTTDAICCVVFPVQTRVAPTGITISNANHFQVVATAAFTASSVAYNSASNVCGFIQLTSSGMTAGSGSGARFNSVSGQLLFTGCEL